MSKARNLARLIVGSNGAVDAGNLTNAVPADGSITSAKIADATIVTADLADGAVATAKIADSAVTTAKITDANVTIAKLSATGTASNSTFLRGDGSWQALSVPASPGTQTFTSSGTFTVPAGVSLIKVTVVGGGGGGGGGYQASNYSNAGGGTGGGGGVAVGYVSVTPGSTHTVTIGAGGAGTNSWSNGSAGGTSSFGSVLSATGGGGGLRAAPFSCGENSCASTGGNGSVGGGSGSARNTVSIPVSWSQYTRSRGGGKTAGIEYSIGFTDGGAGAGGQGESNADGNNAAGGVGGAVLVEW